jgi:AraC-like DNA-binding protein
MGVIMAKARHSVLYDIDVDEAMPPGCSVTAWRPAVPGIREVFHARIRDYAYPAHCHDTWTVLIVDAGAISYDLDTRHCGAAGLTIAILPPGVIHTGQPAPGARGFRKRNLYLDEAFLPQRLVGAAVDHTNLTDTQLRAALCGLHDSLVAREEPLDGEARLALIGDRILDHIGITNTSERRTEPAVAFQLRALLDERLPGSLSLAPAAAALGRSVPHLVRSFTTTFGVSPHAYTIGRRVELARKLLLSGINAADVATQAGFYDQAHFTRHFRRYTSATPARYANSFR